MKSVQIISLLGAAGLLASCAFHTTPLPANHPADPNAAESVMPAAMPILTGEEQTNSMPVGKDTMPDEHQHVHGKGSAK
ncbi:hypothetical protein [Pedosphaera parvula]|uniref:Lipoprotein n=1 Tax=Pedosphaera parvula (strain Ellin514) TaxID=320771 RepID=B9XQN8_PEDPL|nr:hypothetical protein [Pedosphaera parvula]EEF57820.1 hypothetical protein Cflav_PD0802 [Pedosphaera parvula Ellin514]